MNHPIRKNALFVSLALFSLCYTGLEAVTCTAIANDADYHTAITASDCSTGGAGAITITGPFTASTTGNTLYASDTTFTIANTGGPTITGSSGAFDLLTVASTSSASKTVTINSGLTYQTGTITLDASAASAQPVTLILANPATLGTGTTVNPKSSFNGGTPILEFTGSGSVQGNLSITTLGVVAVDSGQTVNLIGNVSGGTLQVNGPGTLIVSGTNTNTGGTNLTSGANFNVNTTSSVSGNIAAGAGTLVNIASSSAFAVTGTVTAAGSASFTQSAGTVNALVTSLGTATHFLTGGTLNSATLDGSSVLNMSGGTLGSGATALTLSGTSVIFTSGTSSVSGNIAAGSGTQVRIDSSSPSAVTGAVTTTGSAIFFQSGGTVNALVTSAGSASHGVSGGTLKSATLDGSSSLSVSGSSTLGIGTGTALTLSGTSLITTSGTSSVSGGISAGARTQVTIGSTSSSAVTGTVTTAGSGRFTQTAGTVLALVTSAGTASHRVSGGTLKSATLDGSSSLTLSGGTLGIGSGTAITLSGTSRITTSGTSLVSGNISAGSGTKVVINSTNSPAVVGNVTVDGTLSGTATIQGTVTVNSGGVISPGNSPGAMTVRTLTLTPGSTTNISITPTQNSELIITSFATLDGKVNVVAGPGPYMETGQYTIIDAHAGSYSGTFSGITGGLPGYRLSLSYDTPYYVYLLYQPAQISTISLSGNALKVANYLNDNAAYSTIGLFYGFSDSQLQGAMNAISPSRNSFGTYASTQTLFSVSNLLSAHVDSFRVLQKPSSKGKQLSALTADSSDTIYMPSSDQAENKFSAWVTGFGEFAHLSAISQNPSFNYLAGAVLAGLDYNQGNTDLVGCSLGYAHTYYYEAGSAGHGDTNSYVGSVYGSAHIKDFYFSPAICGVFNQTDNTRNISFTGFSEKAHADIFAWQLIPHLEVGYEFAFSWGDVIPFISADWAINWQRGYQEHGASPFNAKQKANNSSMVRSETGLKFSESWEKSWGALILKEKASYVFEKPFGTGTVNTSFVGSPGSFTVTAVNQNLNLGAVGLNFLVAVGKKKLIKVDFGYEGEFGVNFWSNDITLTLSKEF